MKIASCAKKDLAGCLALNRLLAGFAGKHQVGVVFPDYLPDAENSNPFSADLVAHERGMVLDHILSWLDAHVPEGSDAACRTSRGLWRHGRSLGHEHLSY